MASNPSKTKKQGATVAAAPDSKPKKKEKGGDKSKVSLEDFEVMHLLGKGAFGEVYLVKHKASGRVMALKQMSKELIKTLNKVEHVKNEKRVLTNNTSAYMVKMHYSFQTDDCLYLAMEYCSGGDLRDFLSAICVLEEQEATLYMAEMIMAVHHLHQMKFIHRDLKPDNFLIDPRGHLKLADFGLSKATAVAVPAQSPVIQEEIKKRQNRLSLLPEAQTQERTTGANLQKRFRKTTTLKPGTLSGLSTLGEDSDSVSTVVARAAPKLPGANVTYRKMLAKSVVGSPDYMSPEVTAGLLESGAQEGYGEEVDWWSLGCVFFEMVLGAPPFQGESTDEIFDNINNYKRILPGTLEQYREHMSPEFFSLISGFLCEPSKRLGKDIHQIQNHPFFKKANLDWERLDKLEPPFVPNAPQV